MALHVLVDAENSAQNFCSTKIDRPPSGIQVVVFVGKGRRATLPSVPPWVAVNEALTDGPEAADTALVAYAAKTFLSSSFGSWSSTTRVVIVCGGEKRYAELVAMLSATSRLEAKVLDARHSKLVDLIPDACTHCDRMLQYHERDHKDARCPLPLCGATFRCRGEQETRKDEHQLRCFTACPETCSFRFCLAARARPEVQAHTIAHPKCTEKSCECDEIFLDNAALGVHLSLLRISPWPCKHCKERFCDKTTLVQHALVHRDKYPSDQVCACGQPYVDEVHRKNHRSRCASAKVARAAP